MLTVFAVVLWPCCGHFRMRDPFSTIKKNSTKGRRRILSATNVIGKKREEDANLEVTRNFNG